MKKKLPWLVGISIATGLVGSLLVKNNKNTQNETQDFVGHWFYFQPRTQKKVTVSITPTYQLLMNGRLASNVVVELNPQRLVFLDALGYHLILEKRETEVFFYDETEDRDFPLTKDLDNNSTS